MANVITSRRSGLVLRGGRQRRETVWGFIGPLGVTIASVSTANLAASLSAAALALRPFTIVRVRFSYLYRSDQASADEAYSVAFGMCVVSDQAVAIGVTAVPTPATDAGSDLWFVHDFGFGALEADSTAGRLAEMGHSRNVDSKAMRKVEEGEDMVAVIETTALSNGMVFNGAGRFLLKLH